MLAAFALAGFDGYVEVEFTTAARPFESAGATPLAVLRSAVV